MDYNAARKELEELQKQLKEKSEAVLMDVFKEAFKDIPELKTIAWTQYTPSFNDGDPCYFILGDIVFSSTEWENVEENVDDFDDVRNKTTKDIAILINSVSNILEILYGEYGAFVRVHKDGIEVEDYDCGY